ncbi:MAG: hypothetical protein ACPKPY_10330 [Nitrososphaeraceae archaeon]
MLSEIGLWEQIVLDRCTKCSIVLVVDQQEDKQDVAIVELFNPVFDSNKKVLKYEIDTNNVTSIELPEEFGQTTVVVDIGGYSLNK